MGWSFLTILTGVTVVASFTLLYIYWSNKDNPQVEDFNYRSGIPVQEKLSSKECIPVCLSKECVTYSKFLLSNMKQNADPCENIHTFSCGKYEEKFAKTDRGSMHFVTERNMFKIMDDILRNIEADPESASGKMKIVYDSCMNYASREKSAFTSAKNFLANVGIPNWPNLSPEFEFDVVTTLANMKQQGEILFLMFVVPFREFSYEYTPASQSNMSIRIDLRYFNDLLREPKKASIIHIFKYFGLNLEAMDIIWSHYTTVRRIILLLKDENCRNTKVYLQCPDYLLEKEENCRFSYGSCPNPYTDDDIWFSKVHANDCPASNFTCSDPNHDPSFICKMVEFYLNTSGLNAKINKEHIKIDDGDHHFITEIIPILKILPAKMVANFLALDYYLRHLEELNFYFQLTKERYFAHKRCDGWKPRIGLNLWRTCTGWIVNNMHLAAQYEFQKNFLNIHEMQRILEAFEEGKFEVADAVSRQKWMPAYDRKLVENTVRRLTFTLVHLKEYQARPEKYELAINKYYEAFQPVRDNFFQNAVELRKTINDIHWLLSPINPYINSVKFMKQAIYRCLNIVYHFGKLAPPHYVPGLPRIINFILLTTFLGHEIGHGMDLPIEWGLKDSVLYNKKKERQHCFAEQYSKFKYEFADGNYIGSQYSQENTADSIATFLIDKFIDKYYNNASLHEKILLPGMNYTATQILYIAVSELFCSKINNREEMMYREGALHAPWKLRSIGPMQNSKGFSQAFNCSEGSYMNPSNKCAIFDWV